MAKDFLFETETCGRCGGSGNYSYNRVHGAVCYGCNGNRVRLTKRGAAAQAWFRKQQTVRLEDLRVGDRVWEESFFGGFAAWFRVEAIEGDRVDLAFQRKHKSEPDLMSTQGKVEF